MIETKLALLQTVFTCELACENCRLLDGATTRGSESQRLAFVLVGTGFPFLSSLSFSLSFSLSRWKQKIVVRYRTFTAALRLLSETGRSRQPILSLHRRFYAPLMESKLRTIERSTTPRAS